MCSTGMGWVVNPSTSGKRVMLLKVPSSKSNATWITVEGRSLVCEVILELDPPKILLHTHVTGSKVLNTTTPDERREKRLISTSCMLLAFGKKACKNCVYIAKLWRNREGKRKMEDKGWPHDKCNVWFLATEGLKEKIFTQRKEIRSDMAREKRMKDEMVEFQESDSWDLKKLFDRVESKDVPPGMKLLWEVQTKQLSVKSPKGYRWHPRLFVKFL